VTRADAEAKVLHQFVYRTTPLAWVPVARRHVTAEERQKVWQDVETMKFAIAFALVALTAPAQDRPLPKKIPIADGIVLFVTPPYGDVGLDGNSIAILSRDGVFVFDTNGTPAAAAAVLAEIRKLTDRPVRYVANSHWHWDHWYGTETYQRAFPDLRVIAHEKTREMMQGPALAFNKPGLETQLPAYIQGLEKRVTAARTATPPPADLPGLEHRLAEDRFFLEQKTNVHHVAANVTFSGKVEIQMGERRIQLLHYDRAVTPGDAFVYLPDEKILITGDLLINPISFALSCYPTEWLRTLEKIDALDATIIVPGHGEPLRDKQLLHATMDVFRELLRGGKDAKSKGLDPDQARTAIMPEIHDLMVKITRDDAALNQAFTVQLVDWYLHRVYDELNGPLDDTIAAIPQK
jgi:glyoxylase-like metal-dependent hydrolase (beta-lactamase superfamily II)